ncbi:MAG: DUF1868 domain-containing protein [Legionella sp.]|nr:DUF1868 domain-containing protein [Legionella sp.]
MALKKLNQNGRYTRFPGITVIAKVRDSDASIFRDIQNMLMKNEEVMAHFSPLPSESYHMTAINLFTEYSEGSNQWGDFVRQNQPFFQSLDATLTQENFEPTVSVQALNVRGALQIIVRLPKQFEDVIQRIASENKVSFGIPQNFHITLGYQFKALASERLEALTNQLKSNIVSILRGHQITTITLNAPKLCFFNDMTAYTPWDGKSFPFEERMTTPNNHMFLPLHQLQASQEQNDTPTCRCNIS